MTTRRQSHSRPPHQHALARFSALSLLLLAFWLRAAGIGRRPLWFDEALEYWVATAPLPQLVPTVLQGLLDPPLYSLLLHYWMRLGQHEFVLRSLSLLASVLAVAALFALGRLLGGPKAAILAALLLAIAPTQIRYAQEVGQYALMICTVTLSLLTLLLAAGNNRWSWWLGWMIASTLAVYGYYAALLVIGPAAAVVTLQLVWQRRWRVVARLLTAALLCLALALPLALRWLPQQMAFWQSNDLFQPRSEPLLSLAANVFAQTRPMLVYQLTGYADGAIPWPLWSQWGVVTLALLLILAALSGVGQRRLVLFLLAAWAAYFLAGWLGPYPYGGSRHALILSPLLSATFAVGLLALWQRSRLLTLCALIPFGFFFALAPQELPQDLRTVTHYWLGQQERSGFPTYVYYGAAPGFRYQQRLAQAAAGQHSPAVPPLWYVDCWRDKPLPYCDDGQIQYGRWIRALPAAEKRAAILNALDPAAGGFWLIISHTSGSEEAELLEAFTGDYEVADQRQAVGAAAYLLTVTGQPFIVR